MRIVAINSCTYGSTGSIMQSIAQTAIAHGHEAYIAFPNGRHKERNRLAGRNIPAIPFSSRFSENFHLLADRLTGFNGCFSVFSTAALLRKLDKLQPDLLHLHNLHNCYINLPMLFRYIKKRRLRVVWTLHDCWAFTGHCPHFDGIGCEKWQTGCESCPQYRCYPKSLVDRSGFMYRRKKKWFSGVENLTLVTPSAWLAELAGRSFLGDYPIRVIPNGIDLSVFHPAGNKKEQWKDKFVILGVAAVWAEAKGLDIFAELAKRLKDRFQIALVGTDEAVDRKLPGNIVSIHRTADPHELAELYTAADLFVNPTRQDNFPTVNLEALACGTPVLTFRTGGSPEAIDADCGMVVEKDDIDALERAIRSIAEKRPFAPENCIRRAQEFAADHQFEKYVKLYEAGAT